MFSQDNFFSHFMEHYNFHFRQGFATSFAKQIKKEWKEGVVWLKINFVTHANCGLLSAITESLSRISLLLSYRI